MFDERTLRTRFQTRGEPIFKERCASCHEVPIERAPSRQELTRRTPESIVEALTNGAMKPMAQGLSAEDIDAVAGYLTGKIPTAYASLPPDPNKCARSRPINMNGPRWNGWGVDVRNTRYQPNPGFKAEDVGRLKVKWTFQVPGVKNGQPTIIGDRVFIAGFGGGVYSLDRDTGCVHWRYDGKGGVRTAPIIARSGAAPSGFAAYFGDNRQTVHAVDANSGRVLWSTKIEEHGRTIMTGTPKLYNGVLYMPTSSGEESIAGIGSYECCTFRGSVTAIDVRNGRILWKTYMIPEAPKPTRRNSAGTQMWGPAGAAIWSSPTIDEKRGLVYVATGDSYTEVPESSSDAIVAMDLRDGRIRWIKQVVVGDNFLSGCSNTPNRAVNCPLGTVGPDHDYGASPILITLPNGRDVILSGNKNGAAYAMDPDDKGNILWSTKLGQGGALGGIEFGMAYDGRRLFVPMADNIGGGSPKPGITALNPETGAIVWHYDAQQATCSLPSGRCNRGYSAPASAIPGLVFAPSLDGHLRAFAAEDGKLVWDFDTAAQAYDTANGIKGARGASMDGTGPTFGGGMMFQWTGYNGTAGGSNLLMAFSVDGK